MRWSRRKNEQSAAPEGPAGSTAGVPTRPAAAAPLPQVEGYEVIDVLGHGASSTVFRARQIDFDRFVALKVLNVDVSDRRAQKRFQRERSVSGRLSSHPNVVTVLDSGFVNERYPYLAMELFDSGSLSERLHADGPFDVDTTLHVGIRIAGALESAHRHGVLHRDVKPQNILLSRYGEPALADFGIATILEMEQSMTNSLTPVHAAPEILEGAEPTGAADVYALASTLFTLLAGTPPFAGPSGEGILAQLLRIATNEVPPLARRDVPPEMIEALRRALAKSPADRPDSAAAFGQQLQRIQADIGRPVTALPVESDRGLSATVPLDLGRVPTTPAIDAGTSADETATPAAPAPDAPAPDAAGPNGPAPAHDDGAWRDDAVTTEAEAWPVASTTPSEDIWRAEYQPSVRAAAAPDAPEVAPASDDGAVAPDVRPAVARRDDTITPSRPSGRPPAADADIDHGDVTINRPIDTPTVIGRQRRTPEPVRPVQRRWAVVAAAVLLPAAAIGGGFALFRSTRSSGSSGTTIVDTAVPSVAPSVEPSAVPTAAPTAPPTAPAPTASATTTSLDPMNYAATNLRVSYDATGAFLSWTDVSDGSAVFTVEFAELGMPLDSEVVQPGAKSVSIPGLSRDSDVCFAVTARVIDENRVPRRVAISQLCQNRAESALAEPATVTMITSFPVIDPAASTMPATIPPTGP